VVFALSVALIPLPVAARAPNTPPVPDQPNPAAVETLKPPQQPLRAAIEKVDARELQPAPARRAMRRSAQSTDVNKESTAFFKSGTGIVVLAAIAAGVGYALYSVSNDRITSPGKE
jgi:hypothetical protein